VANAAFVLVALALGEAALRGAERLIGSVSGRPPDRSASLVRFGAALLAGLGVVASVGMALGVAHLFGRMSLIAAGVGALVLCRRPLAFQLLWLRRVPERATTILREDRVLVVPAVAAIGLYLVHYAVALGPVVAWDALAYHLPNADALIDTHELPASLGGHWLYGTVPLLADVLWAQGIVLVDYSFSQTLHVTIAGAFLILSTGIVARLWGWRTAAVAAVLLGIYPEFWLNAQSPYVDAAAASFETGALLCGVAFAQSRRSEYLAWSALLIGFALGVKYSAAPTALILAALVGFVLRRELGGRAALRTGAVAAGLAALAGGYWYAKNLIHYGNPTYPLYFGHDGIDDATYQSALDAIQAFGPRTLGAFLRVPEQFEWPLNEAVRVAIYLAPLVLLVRRARPANALLFAYAAIYAVYWFFLATHQTRFLIPAVLVMLLALAVTTVAAAERLPRPALAAAAAALLAVVAINFAPISGTTWRTQLGAPAGVPSYLLGRSSTDDYLTENLGCSYAATAYLRRAGAEGGVIDNWSNWHDPYLGIYAKHNPHRDFAADPRDPNLFGLLREDDLRYLLVNDGSKGAAFADRDPFVTEYREMRARAEARILRSSRVIWREDLCRLYEIEPEEGRPLSPASGWSRVEPAARRASRPGPRPGRASAPVSRGRGG
jgi:hypothetical protein